MEKHTGTSEKSHSIRKRHDVSRWVTGYLSRTGTGEGGEQKAAHRALDPDGKGAHTDLCDCLAPAMSIAMALH